MKQRRIMLTEQEIPTHWYNIRADMENPAPPLLDSKTLQPISADDLGMIFPDELVDHMMTTERWVEIPEPVREAYSLWRPTPLHRAYELEKRLDTPAKIYYKNESVAITGSHKINTAFPQAYFHSKKHCQRLLSECSTGQWGAALCFVANHFGMSAEAFLMKLTYLREDYYRLLMETLGAEVKASPSRSTKAGVASHNERPFSTGIPAVATAEALEVAVKNQPHTGYLMPGILGHADIHQSIIGLETIKQFEKIGEMPDVVIAAYGFGTAFAGLAYPMMHWAKENDKAMRFIAAESSACPRFSRGEYRYDLIDASGTLPLAPMYTVGHDFETSPIFAGNMRYHGSGVTASRLFKDNAFEVAEINNVDGLVGGKHLGFSEGAITSYSSSYALAAVMREAQACKESGEEKTIVFCLDGLGVAESAGLKTFPTPAYRVERASDEEIQASLARLLGAFPPPPSLI